MRIALTNPTTWPYVRRGAERFMNELAAYLAARGHEVTVLSGKPGLTRVVDERGYRTVMLGRWWHPALGRFGVLESHAFFGRVLPSLLTGGFDVVLGCGFLESYAATLARKLTGAPVVFWVNSLPPPISYVRAISTGGKLFRRLLRDADEVIVLSRFMQEWFQSKHARATIAIPVPVDLARFALARERDHSRPIVFCASALDDPRKGGACLFQAFELLKHRRPTVRLVIGSRLSDDQRESFLQYLSPASRADVEFLAPGSLNELPRLYGEAAITVLPSRWESFGMVMTESLATGTPVVGTREGALPEIIGTPEVGRMFDVAPNAGIDPANPEALAVAMEETLDLSARPETAERCRAWATQFGWETLGPRFENIFEQLAAGKKRAAA